MRGAHDRPRLRGILRLVFARPFHIETRTNEVRPALQEGLGQPDPLEIGEHARDIVGDQVEGELTAVFQGIAGSRIAVARLADGGQTDQPASGDGAIQRPPRPASSLTPQGRSTA